MALHLQTRGRDHDIRHALSHRVAVEPEAVTASLVAADNPGGLWHPKARLRSDHFLPHRGDITGWATAFPGALRRPCRAGQLPGIDAELKSEKHCRLLGALLIMPGRCCDGHGSTPAVGQMADWVRFLKELNSSDLLVSAHLHRISISIIGLQATAASVRSCLAVRRNSSNCIPEESGEDLEDILKVSRLTGAER
jgi:hypothetical protein